MRETVSSPRFATQTAPPPMVSPSGRSPTGSSRSPAARDGVDAGDRVVGGVGHPHRAAAVDRAHGLPADADRRAVDGAVARVDPHDRPVALIHDPAGESNAAIEKEFQRLADKAQETRDNLSELDPPDDAKEEFDALLAALEEGTSDLEAVAEAAGSDDPAKAAEAAQDLVKSGTKIQQAETELQQAVDG